MPQPYEWAVLRVVPRVERGEFVNVGVVVYCQALDFLDAARHRPTSTVRSRSTPASTSAPC